jgi:hypothetical protein
MNERMAVTLTVEELRALIRVELDAAREREKPPEPEPALVNAHRMAWILNVSRTTIHRLRLDGCPVVRVGDTYKYEPEAVIAWLKARTQKAERQGLI